MAPVPVQPVSPPANDLLSQMPPEAAAIHRELRELASRYPPPDKEEVAADDQWLWDHWRSPDLAPYRRSFIAVVGGKVLGNGPEVFRLQRDVARDYGLHPQRIRVGYVYDWDRVFQDGDDVNDW